MRTESRTVVLFVQRVFVNRSKELAQEVGFHNEESHDDKRPSFACQLVQNFNPSKKFNSILICRSDLETSPTRCTYFICEKHIGAEK